ncbi:MAG: PAAR-like domain-containing protein [Nitrosomonas sp.]
MANEVYANGREIACKAGAGKTICAMPDVCFTPPENPATPPGIPVPYPNTGSASDTTEGSKTVQISDKEIMLKHISYFKTLVGDEAGCAAKKGVITSTNKGKVYFEAWSMDVKFEGENVDRHLDLTTTNHASDPGDAPPWAYVDSASLKSIDACKEEVARKNEACKGKKTRSEQCADKKCNDAKKCLLVTFNQGSRGSESTQVGCCEGETPHHLVEVHGFMQPSGRQSNLKLPQFPNYEQNNAPCVCASAGKGWDNAKEGDHGFLHALQGKLELAAIHNAPVGQKDYAWNYGQSKAAGIRAHQQTFTNSHCSKKCLAAQLDSYHNAQGITNQTPVRTETPKLSGNQKDLANELIPEVSISTW